MELTSITARVKKDAESLMPVEMDFLVDPAATVTIVPEKVLSDLGVDAAGEQTVVLGDGTKGARKVARVYLQIRNRGATVTAAFGPSRERPRLAPAVLEACGLRLDPAGRILPRT